MREIKSSELWNELVIEHNNDIDKVYEVMVDVLSGGLCAMYDDEQIEKAKQSIAKKYLNKLYKKNLWEK